MNFLESYIKEYKENYSGWDSERAGFVYFAIVFVLVFVFTRNPPISLAIGILILWMITQETPRILLSSDGRTVRLLNHGDGLGFPKLLLPRHILSIIHRIIFPVNKSYEDVKRVAGAILNMSSPEVVLRVYQPKPVFPRRQIIISNHIHTPIRDAFSFFPFIPKNSDFIIVQHNFHWFISSVARKLYGAWTIDKDDKSKVGKHNMVTQLTKLLMYMRSREDCTVVIYPAGKVPKSPDEEIGQFYPGAFYLALMSGYFITPLVNRYTKQGTFSTSLHRPVDICSEYSQKIVHEKTIEKFRISNGDILNEICERFRRYFLHEQDHVESLDKIVETSLHGSNIGTGMNDGTLS